MSNEKVNEKVYEITFCRTHVYKILRMGNIEGGGSKVSPKQFDEEILGEILTRTLINYYALMPDKQLSKALISVKKTMPVEMISMSWKIKRFIDAHRPLQMLPIGLMNAIIEMERMGITESKVYFSLLNHIDNNPPKSFTDYIRIITEFEKGSD